MINCMYKFNSLKKKKTIIFKFKNTLVENFDQIIFIKNGQIKKITIN
jgi:ABC-type transport system involved in cytochrome bd biosynthesis fused ATPase/permease subunit